MRCAVFATTLLGAVMLAAPSHAAPTVLSGVLMGSGGVYPGLDAFPTSVTWSFTGSLTAVGTSTALTYRCSFSFTGLDSVAFGVGSGNGSCDDEHLGGFFGASFVYEHHGATLTFTGGQLVAEVALTFVDQGPATGYNLAGVLTYASAA